MLERTKQLQDRGKLFRAYGAVPAASVRPGIPGETEAVGPKMGRKSSRQFAATASITGLIDISESGVQCGPTGVPFCFGDGTGTACPCGNAGKHDCTSWRSLVHGKVNGAPCPSPMEAQEDTKRIRGSTS